MGPLVAVQDELLPCLPIVVGQVDFLKFSSFVLYTFFFFLKIMDALFVLWKDVLQLEIQCFCFCFVF